jgi:hypothetical protein
MHNHDCMFNIFYLQSPSNWSSLEVILLGTDDVLELTFAILAEFEWNWDQFHIELTSLVAMHWYIQNGTLIKNSFPPIKNSVMFRFAYISVLFTKSGVLLQHRRNNINCVPSSRSSLEVILFHNCELMTAVFTPSLEINERVESLPRSSYKFWWNREVHRRFKININPLSNHIATEHSRCWSQ